MRALALLLVTSLLAAPVSAALVDDLREAKKLVRRLERDEPEGYEALIDDLLDDLDGRVEGEVRAATVAIDLHAPSIPRAERAARRATGRHDRSGDAASRRKRLRLLRKAATGARRTFRLLRRRSPDEATALKQPVATIPDDRIDEGSGLAWWHGAFWTMNDGGGQAVLFRSETADFAESTMVPVPGATNVDWEDLAVHEGDLVVADVGDNGRTRDDLVLYRVTFDGAALTLAATWRISYPDGPHDVEAVVSIDGALHAITKDRGEGTLVYRFADLREGIVNVGEFLGAIPLGTEGEKATAADVDAERGELVVLTYAGVHFLDPADLGSGPVRSLPFFGLQAEGIAVAGDLIVITNEQRQVFAALRR